MPRNKGKAMIGPKALIGQTSTIITTFFSHGLILIKVSIITT